MNVSVLLLSFAVSPSDEIRLLANKVGKHPLVRTGLSVDRKPLVSRVKVARKCGRTVPFYNYATGQ